VTHGDATHPVTTVEDEAGAAVDDADVITHSVAHGNPARRRGSRFRVPREARVGIAVTLSFGLLVTVMLLNRGGKGKTPPVNEIAGKAKSAGKQAEKSDDKAVIAETEPNAPAAEAKDPAEKGATSDAAQAPPASVPADALTAVPSPAPVPAQDDKPPANSVPPPAVAEPPPVADAAAEKDPTLAAVPPPAPAEKPEPAEALAPVKPPEPSDATLAPALPPIGANESQPPAAVAGATPAEGGEANAAAAVPPPVTAAEVQPALPAPSAVVEPPAAAASPEPTPTPVEPPANANPTPSLAPAEAAAPTAPAVGPAADSAAPPPAASGALAAPGAMPGAPGGTVGGSSPVAPPSELPNVGAETTPMVPAASPAPEPVTRAQSPGPAAGPTADAAAVVPMSTAGAARDGWVKLPNTRFRQEQDDRIAAKTTPAERPSDHADGPPVRDSAEKIEAIPHVVQRGENFWTISRLYYRSGRYYKALWKANRDKVARMTDLAVGMTIRVPPHEALDAALVDPPAPERVERANGSSVPLRRTSRPVLNGSAPDSSTVRRPVPEEKLTLPAQDTFDDPPPRSRASRRFVEEETDDEEETERPKRPRYRVRSRYETVRSIAKATLGDAHREDEILRLNRRVIQDPYHLTPGQYLELPEDARIGGLGR
jgi:nucleoid-associated protein YgaU